MTSCMKRLICRRNNFMIKKRIHTLLLTLSLLIAAYIRFKFSQFGILPHTPYLAMTMFISTAVYTIGSCMLQTFGHPKLALTLGCITFFIICTALFYSECFGDYAIFFICIALVIWKSTKTCECLDACDQNPLT